jgi:predicted dehydrogenase
MATTVKDAWEIVKIAEDYPSVFQIGLQYRYKAMYAEAIYEAQTRRSVGTIKTISITEHRVPFFDKVKQWNKFARFSGDTLVEKCCHYFDLFNLFAGSRPVKVYASGSMAVNFTDFVYEGQPSDIIDNAMVIVDYDGDIRASFQLCMFAPMFYEQFILCGDEGRLSAYKRQDYLRGSPTCEMQVLSNLDRPARTITPEYPGSIESLGHDGATFFEHAQFVDNILGAPTVTATVMDGFWSVVVGAAAQESIATGQPVQVEQFLVKEGIEPGEATGG